MTYPGQMTWRHVVWTLCFYAALTGAVLWNL